MSSDNIFQLHKPAPCQDIPRMLRDLADGIEAGIYGTVTTAVTVIGHSVQQTVGEEVLHTEDSSIFSAGPRDDLFTVRGLLYTGLASITT